MALPREIPKSQKGFIVLPAMLVFLFIVLTGSVQICAQQPTPTPGAPVPPPTSELERRVYQLEVVQSQTIESLKSSNDASRTSITVFSVFLGVLVGLQTFVSLGQWRREGRSASQQTRREDERDLVERTGVEQVSKIMSVVQQTLQGRFEAEKQAREDATRAQEQLEKVLREIKVLDTFYRNFQEKIRDARQTIEEQASQLAQISRHDFRKGTNALNSFAQRVDTFKTEFAPLEEKHRPFSSRVPYIRGIAAHYANQPEIAKQYLMEVVASKQPELRETEIDHNRRVANAYYYLGLIDSNFGKYRDALDCFDEANQLDVRGQDLLTKVLIADTHVMANDFDKAMQFITEVEEGLREIERRDRLSRPDLRLRSRAALIKASMVMMKHEANWHEEARKLLEEVHAADPLYYYATVTLAQVCLAQGDTSHAREIFREAYQAIEQSGDLITVTEARIKILLLLVAGLCCRHGLKDEKRSEEHLAEADALRDSLPKIGSQTCTVFSTLSKRNEDSNVIHDHIELIRKGDVLAIH